MLSNSKIQHAITGTSTSVANQVAFYRQLHDAQDSNLKRSMKHTEQAKKCLDCLTLLGEIKGITEAEEANKEMDYHGCFMAVDNH